MIKIGVHLRLDHSIEASSLCLLHRYSTMRYDAATAAAANITAVVVQ